MLLTLRAPRALRGQLYKIRRHESTIVHARASYWDWLRGNPVEQQVSLVQFLAILMIQAATVAEMSRA